MSKKVVAIVGSYRKGGTTDQVVDAVLGGAGAKGAETLKIYLVDRYIEFCQNCRVCTQTPGEERGKCPQDDEMEEILREVESADAVVLASPVNYYNATAIFRRFLERLVGAVYWPWGQKAPQPRKKRPTRKAVLVATSAMPGFLIPMTTGTGKALELAAASLGAKPVARLWVGLAGGEPQHELSAGSLRRAQKIGYGLAA